MSPSSLSWSWTRSFISSIQKQLTCSVPKDTVLTSRLFSGTAQYPSPEQLRAAVERSQAEVVTVSLPREAAGDGSGQCFWQLIQSLGVRVLPNTAGCRTVQEAVTTAHMAREVFATPWVKLEVIGDDATLQPDVFGLVVAAHVLSEDGFQVFPYTTEDLLVAERLLAAGYRILMPWGAPIGSGRGLNNLYGLRQLRAPFPEIPLVVDAGIGSPSPAAQALELGYDAVLLNTAVSKAGDPPVMAEAFAQAVNAGRLAYEAGLMEAHDLAVPSTPEFGTPFSPWSGHA